MMKPVIGITCALKTGWYGTGTYALPIYHVSTDYCLAVRRWMQFP